ncbi:MAG TPA: hypothetical protein VF817_00075 [Patescibacteria group bacterium]
MRKAVVCVQGCLWGDPLKGFKGDLKFVATLLKKGYIKEIHIVGTGLRRSKAIEEAHKLLCYECLCDASEVIIDAPERMIGKWILEEKVRKVRGEECGISVIIAAHLREHADKFLKILDQQGHFCCAFLDETSELAALRHEAILSAL